ncbi:hypothetical protein SBDP1_80002 [Syntrophobacter sp. SbD1]|nr:hypothetical protein SBDP1_80002 [Syntrophobacter sp. SbD1]
METREESGFLKPTGPSFLRSLFGNFIRISLAPGPGDRVDNAA